MERLRTITGNLTLYYAGLPSFTRNFSRDTLIAGIILQDAKMLHDQLYFCVTQQGKKKDAHTGEEPGKIHHEFPGVELEGKSTLYNACDTTALFIIASSAYQKLTHDDKFFYENKHAIENAVKYIQKHIRRDLFYEDPRHCCAKRFALKTTYWKDAQYFGREKPQYPVMFTLAHIQNVCALRCAARMLNRRDYHMQADKMAKKIINYIDCILVDNKGKVKGVSSDILHALFYLEPTDLNLKQRKMVLGMAKRLQTRAGYRTLDPRFAFKLGKDSYDYPNTVWPFEQALIHIRAQMHGIKKLTQVSARVMTYTKTEPEYLRLTGKYVEGGGCDPQLWTIAAKIYFQKMNAQSEKSAKKQSFQ